MRAINVGGRAIVKMTALSEAFAAAGCSGVRTYIQSGNVIFESRQEPAALFQKIRVRLRDLLGAEPGVVFRTVEELERMVRSAPFKDFEQEPGLKLYAVFLSEPPRRKPRFPLVSSAERLEAVKMKNLDVFVVSRRKKSGFYGFPNNFVEKELGVSATSRNWSTVSRIVQLIRDE
jgi:uncharacterized protein (DUF1697 family)